jgi:hypothetical protein
VSSGNPMPISRPGFVLGLVAGAIVPPLALLGLFLSIFLRLSEFKDANLLVLGGVFSMVAIGSVGWVILRWIQLGREDRLAGLAPGLVAGLALGVCLSFLVGVGMCGRLIP